MERKQTKMMETQPCMVSFHLIDKKKGQSDEEDRCFLSVLLFNYRNNGRFPFQLIILLVSRPHCTRTGRDKLIVGNVLKFNGIVVCAVSKDTQKGSSVWLSVAIR